jgi:hypothetical protein
VNPLPQSNEAAYDVEVRAGRPLSRTAVPAAAAPRSLPEGVPLMWLAPVTDREFPETGAIAPRWTFVSGILAVCAGFWALLIWSVAQIL